jgi:hypothetical protein
LTIVVYCATTANSLKQSSVLDHAGSISYFFATIQSSAEWRAALQRKEEKRKRNESPTDFDFTDGISD